MFEVYFRTLRDKKQTGRHTLIQATLSSMPVCVCAYIFSLPVKVARLWISSFKTFPRKVLEVRVIFIILIGKKVSFQNSQVDLVLVTSISVIRSLS